MKKRPYVQPASGDVQQLGKGVLCASGSGNESVGVNSGHTLSDANFY